MFRKGKKRHSSSSSQSSEISTKSKSVDSSLGGLSRSSTVASLDTDSTKSSGQSNSNSDTCAEFRVKYVGAIEKLNLDESKTLEGPLDLINYIDVAQQDGKLPFVPGEEFIMGVSKYGIKVTSLDQYLNFLETAQRKKQLRLYSVEYGQRELQGSRRREGAAEFKSPPPTS